MYEGQLHAYICSLHSVGENEPTDKDPYPVPATASREKVCFFILYVYILLFIQ